MMIIGFKPVWNSANEEQELDAATQQHIRQKQMDERIYDPRPERQEPPRPHYHDRTQRTLQNPPPQTGRADSVGNQAPQGQCLSSIWNKNVTARKHITQ